MYSKLLTMTPFEKAVAAALNGELATPSVAVGNDQIDYFYYQLAVHKHNLHVLAIPLKMRGVKLKDLKNYYGLKGKTAKDCLPEFEAIFQAYKNSLEVA